MSKVETVKGVLKMFLAITMEDWDEMDHKLLRIAAGAVGFAVMAFFWYFVFKNVGPF